MWSLEANAEFADTAYSNIPLMTHTDTTYLDNPMGIQVFHALRSDCVGGETLLVDGFNVASTLRNRNYGAYKVAVLGPNVFPLNLED